MTGNGRKGRLKACGKAVITHLMIDIDGVVVTGRVSDGAHWKSGLREDLGLDPALLRKHFFQPYWVQIVTGKLALRPTLTKVLQGFAPKISATTLMNYWFTQDARLNTELLGDLDKARTKGLKVYLTTNQEHERAAFLWNNLGLSQHADGIITSAALGLKKPDPAFFKAAETVTKAPAQTHLLIDDTPENIEGAEIAGWRASLWDTKNSLTLTLA